jgi:hypothetical protein
MPKVDTPGNTGLSANTLSQAESDALSLFFNRGLRDYRTEGNGRLRQFLQQYRGEIDQAAEVAKATFDKEFDGHQPQSGSFGVSRIRPGYFGYDSWDNCPDATEGSVTTWLDNSTPDNLSGSGGVDSPLTVGEPVVHLIVGFATHAESPKAEAIKLRLNDQPRTSIQVGEEFRKTDLRYAPLSTPILLKDDDDVYAEFYADADGAESLYPVGLTFIEAKDYRELDPSNMAGTDDDNIVVE